MKSLNHTIIQEILSVDPLNIQFFKIVLVTFPICRWKFWIFFLTGLTVWLLWKLVYILLDGLADSLVGISEEIFSVRSLTRILFLGDFEFGFRKFGARGVDLVDYHLVGLVFKETIWAKDHVINVSFDGKYFDVWDSDENIWISSRFIRLGFEISDCSWNWQSSWENS